VQRWERQYDLPIHRVGSGARSPVFALPSELNLWLLRTSQREKLENPDVADIQPTRELRVTGRSHTLLMRSRLLTSKLIILTNIQRQRAEELQKTVLKIAGRFPKANINDSVMASQAQLPHGSDTLSLPRRLGQAG